MEKKRKTHASKITCVYIITCKSTGMRYVGQTIAFRQRKYQHLQFARNWVPPTDPCWIDKYPLYDAMVKYGPADFTWERYPCDVDHLNKREAMLIEKYNTIWPNGYNKKPGGMAHAYRKNTPHRVKLRLIMKHKKAAKSTFSKNLYDSFIEAGETPEHARKLAHINHA
jgi:group I intron endonuclease